MICCENVVKILVLWTWHISYFYFMLFQLKLN